MSNGSKNQKIKNHLLIGFCELAALALKTKNQLPAIAVIGRLYSKK
ncbi:MAG: hypothetical protein R2827_11740 [Bdellovibrionales bacterium]